MARVVLINRYFHPDQSATSRLLTDLVTHWAARHDVVVICSRQQLEDARAGLPRRDAFGRARVVRVASTSLGRAWLPGRALDYLSFLASVSAWLLLHLRRGDIVVAKTDPPMLGTVAWIFGALRGARLVNWLQDVYPETAWRLGVGSSDGLVGRALRQLRDRSLRGAAANVAISDGMGRFLQSQAGIAPPAVIPNWADDLRTEGGCLRRSLSLDGRFVLGYSGNLGRAHPIEPLTALAAAFAARPEIHFLISGGGANMDRLRAGIEALKPPNWTFLPYQPLERLGSLLSTADVHIVLLDPRLEHLIFPSKVYGLLSVGKPILHIGDPEGEVARLVRHYECGWSIDVRDEAALTGLVERLARSPEAVRTAGRNARGAFEREFSKPAAMRRWDSTLDAVQVAPHG